MLIPRERFINALNRQSLEGRVPHFDGKVHPLHRNYFQWDQMSKAERKLHSDDMVDIYIATAKRFEHSAIFLHPNPNTNERQSNEMGRSHVRNFTRSKVKIPK